MIEPTDGALRRELVALRDENARLRRLLRLTERDLAPAVGTQSAGFDRTPGPVSARSPNSAKVAFFAALFGARRDTYALFWENRRLGTSGWVPAVAGGWRKSSRDSARYLPLTPAVIAAHLRGDERIGLYPILPGDVCCWLAADFDGPTAMLDALAYLKAARAVEAPAALEISKSGVGAHVWIFFTDPVPAATARQMGTGLVREAIALRGRMDLAGYDRLFPSQDTVPVGGFGNLIAAPLHGRSRHDHGTTLFLDLATLEPYEDQWDYVSSLDRLTPKQVAKVIGRLREPTVGTAVDQLHAARSTKTQPNAAAIVHLRLDGGIGMSADELSPALYSTIKHAASVANPEFFDRQRRRQSTWNISRLVHAYEETMDGRLVVPRGLLDTVSRVVEEAGSSIELDDLRADGEPITASFTATLSTAQQDAVADLAIHDLGVLVAPPGSGKTVMACSAIAQHAISTLILVDRKTLADQWRTQVQAVLGVTPGQLGGGRSKLTGAVDIAMLQTLASRDDLEATTGRYGFVVVDECHHIPAVAFERAARRISARRWLGLTATPYRRDRLDELIAFHLGPVRHTLVPPKTGTIDAAAEGRPDLRLVVHRTTFTDEAAADLSAPRAIAALRRALAEHEARNAQIVRDIDEALARRRNCLVLTERKAHVDLLAERLHARGHTPVVLMGGMGVKARTQAMAQLVATDDQPILAIATGSFIGEGFDCPALDTLFLAAPVSFKGRIVQNVGRVMRVYPGKTTVEVHDYHDAEVPMLAAALGKRAPGYVSLGFTDPRRMPPLDRPSSVNR